jgi:hypothetical protein
MSRMAITMRTYLRAYPRAQAIAPTCFALRIADSFMHASYIFITYQIIIVCSC